jgi:LysM repeat protein
MPQWPLKTRLTAQLIGLAVLIILPAACTLTSNTQPTPIPTSTPPTLVFPTQTPVPTTVAAQPTLTPLPTAAPATVSPQPVPPCPIPQGWVPYQVAPGDTLNAIARRTGTTANQLAVGNCLANPNAIYVGQYLYVPPTVIITPIPVACSPAPRLAIGGTGRVLPGESNALRSAPGQGSNSVVIGQIPAGALFTVLFGPQCTGGINWWQVNYNGQIGWTGEGQGGVYWVEPYVVTTCSPSPRLAVGGLGRVTPGDPNVLRSLPGKGSGSVVIGQIPGGGIFSVLAGPQCADGIYWWQVNYNGITGWTGEGQAGVYWVEPYTASVCPLTPRLVPGGQGRVTPGQPNTLRGQPNGGATVGQIPGGGVFTVVAGPQCAGGINWWQVNYNGVVGWTGEGQGSTYWLEPYTVTACTLPPRLLVGWSGLVTPGTPNVLRSQPGKGSNSIVIGEIPGGAAFRVLAGPQCADGYNWYQVNYNGQIGWTAEGQSGQYWLDILRCSNSVVSRLATNMQARVTPGLPNRLRSQPGTTSPTISEIPGGGLFTIVGGPQCGSEGWVWWQVNYNGVVGWTAEGDATSYWLEPVS